MSGSGSDDARGICSRLQLCYMRSNPEVLALYFGEVSVSILFIGGGVFVNVAILQFANIEAGCERDFDGSYRTCDKRLYAPKRARAGGKRRRGSMDICVFLNVFALSPLHPPTWLRGHMSRALPRRCLRAATGTECGRRRWWRLSRRSRVL